MTMLHGHGNVEMDTTRGQILKNTHDTCVRHACRVGVVSDTFGTRHGSMIELTLLHRLMIQEFICNDLKLEVSDQILVVCFNACFSITF